MAFVNLQNCMDNCSQPDQFVDVPLAVNELDNCMKAVTSAHEFYIGLLDESQDDYDVLCEEVESRMSLLLATVMKTKITFRSYDARSQISTTFPLKQKIPKITFRPLDHDGVELWFQNLQDTFLGHGLTPTDQDACFSILIGLLSKDEAMVINSLSIMDPRPHDIFEKAKELLVSRFQKPWHFRLGSALNQPLNGRKPSAALNTFRLAVSHFSQDDVEKYFILRSLPPTIRTLLCGNTALQTADEMAKAADEAMMNFETGTSHQFTSNSVNTLHLERDMRFSIRNSGKRQGTAKKDVSTLILSSNL